MEAFAGFVPNNQIEIIIGHPAAIQIPRDRLDGLVQEHYRKFKRGWAGK